MKGRAYKKGFTLVEIIVVAGIFFTVVGTFYGASQIAYRAVNKARDNAMTAFLLEEGLEGVRSLRDLSWSKFIDLEVTRGEECFYFNSANSVFATSTLSSFCNNSGGYFSRTITVQNTCRDNSGGGTSGDIIGTTASLTTCSVGTIDTSTKKVTIKVVWGPAYQYSQSADMYIANLYAN